MYTQKEKKIQQNGTTLVMRPALTKIVRKSWEKHRTFPPIFSKWEYCCQNWRIIHQFWHKYSHFEKIGEHILPFSPNFPMIFVSAGGSHIHRILVRAFYFSYLIRNWNGQVLVINVESNVWIIQIRSYFLCIILGYHILDRFSIPHIPLELTSFDMDL